MSKKICQTFIIIYTIQRVSGTSSISSRYFRSIMRLDARYVRHFFLLPYEKIFIAAPVPSGDYLTPVRAISLFTITCGRCRFPQRHLVSSIYRTCTVHLRDLIFLAFSHMSRVRLATCVSRLSLRFKNNSGYRVASLPNQRAARTPRTLRRTRAPILRGIQI